jgi:hypothetical protein
MNDTPNIGNDAHRLIITTFKIPTIAQRELCRAGKSTVLGTAIDTIRSEWDHMAAFVGYMLHDFRETVCVLGVDIDITPSVLAHIVREYDPQYGDDAIPIYHTSTLEWLNTQFRTVDVREAFAFELKMQVKPTFVVHAGQRVTVRDEDMEYRIASVASFPDVWTEAGPYTPTYTNTTYHLNKFGFVQVYRTGIDDDPFETMVLRLLIDIEQRFLAGEGQTS